MATTKKKTAGASLHDKLAKAVEGQDWEKAVEIGIELVTKDPHDAEAISQTGCALGNLDSWKEPLSTLPKVFLAAALNVGANADAAMNVQFAIIDTDRPLATNAKEKVALAMKVVDAFFAAGGKPKTVDHYNNLVNTYLAAGKAERAAELAEEGLKKHKDPFGYHGLACAYGVLGNRKKLFETLEKAKEQYGGFTAIQQDPDMKSWRKEEEFEALFADAIDPQDGREGFTVNLASIEKKFPKDMAVPPLLKELAPWLAKVPFGSLGYFEVMAGEKFHDSGLDAKTNKTIADVTGIFITLGEGSHLALWNHGGKVPAVVLIDSEGQNLTIAASFEEFLVKWSKQKTETELDGEYQDDGPEQQHTKLAGWLVNHEVKAPAAKAPDFGKWFEGLAKTGRKKE